MNVSNEGPHLLALLYLNETERSRGAALAPPVLDVLDRLGLRRVQLVVDREDDVDETSRAEAEAEAEAYPSTHSRRTLEQSLLDANVLSVNAIVAGDRASAARVDLGATLRFPTGAVTAERSPRTLHAIVATGADIPRETACEVTIEWLRACAGRLDILHGGITLVTSHVEAGIEATLVGRDVPRELHARWSYDAYRRNDLWTCARRLYWLTVLGPDLARRSGGAAAARSAGADHVEDVAGSLLFRATGSIADALDPTYPRRTSALRRWMWPYTIQNPVDAELEPATVVLATAGRLVIESPVLGRRVLLASLPELARGDEVHVAFPAAGSDDPLVLRVTTARGQPRILAFRSDGQLQHDFVVRAPAPQRRP